MEYNLTKPWLTLDKWQKDLIKSKGDGVVISGRQCGKSTGTSILAGETALNNPNEFILIGAYVIDQAQLIFRKIHEYILDKDPKQIKNRVTLNFLELKNGSKILCRPIGDTGAGMRGYSATMLIIDEAAFVPDRAWDAIEPVISVTKGRTILLSTPQGKKGFFYKASINPNYFKMKLSARDCPRHTKKFLDQKESELSPVAFATEYLGEFIDDYNRKFSEEWVKKVCCIEKTEQIRIRTSNQYLGIDVSGSGSDETTFEGFDANNPKNIFQTLNIYSKTIQGPQIERQIQQLKEKYHYDKKSIGFDSGGLGSGTFNYMLENDTLKRSIVALDNATRPIEHKKDKQKTTKLLKEYMYDLVEEMGWRGELKCFNEGAVKQSFESIQIEFKDGGKKRYWGTYSHIVEGIVRAVWLAKNKSLNIYIH
jgi:hypothetical protein|tara:strand:+ start:99 stop:1367 length:1269 start_codon:yes stop_codon:yes gene_type:complete